MVTATVQKERVDDESQLANALTEFRLSAVLDEALDGKAIALEAGAWAAEARHEIEPLIEIATMLRLRAWAARRLVIDQ